MVQTSSEELEWDLEPGLDSQSPRHKLDSQASSEIGNTGWIFNSTIVVGSVKCFELLTKI